ncbi:copper homeostasis protein CutC [Vibrio metschnikovii]|uniref:copper homeostasis protein CutC n=1 Tax=Vibrio metschnikovii TaxID=28172 RepID=UPI002A373AB4|nr:copper homeostasis protein CutC [Vibrio metschnikovii]
MNYELEVCIDNIESLHYAIQGGATRIELCSALALGGLTPSYGMMKQSARLSTIPVYAMIRPRQGDFLYDHDDIAMMLDDIDAAAEAKLQGVVIGALTAQGEIDESQVKQLVTRAQQHGLGVTFHRAIDQCRDFRQALELLIDLGCERVLTSGQAPQVEQGISTLADMVSLAKGRIRIMAGAGLTANNVTRIIQQTGVQEVHLSGKSVRPSHMQLKSAAAKMGQADVDDFMIPVTNPTAIAQVAEQLRGLV